MENHILEQGNKNLLDDKKEKKRGYLQRRKIKQYFQVIELRKNEEKDRRGIESITT